MSDDINPYLKFKANCKRCKNRKDKDDGSSMCTVKHIDCSVRKGDRPCSHFDVIQVEKPLKRYKVYLTATAVQEIEARSSEGASKKADWCDADISDWEVSEVEEI